MRYLYTLFILSFFVACTNDFEEINTNPNAPNEAQPKLLLRQVIYNYGEEMSYEGFVAGNLLAQHFTMIDFNLFDRHDLNSPQLGGNPWPIFYRNLRDNEILLNRSRTDNFSMVYEGPALILKAYISAALTDIYGDVPYFEALKGKTGNITAKYDDQSDIYLGANGILDNLTKGIASIQSSPASQSIQGDLLFNGDRGAWIKLANSLRVKYLMRLSEVEDVSAELQEIYDEGNYLATNGENATFDFFNTRPNTFRMAVLRDGDFNLYVQSETMLENLQRFADPRIDVLYRKAASTDTYEALVNGPNASTTSIKVANFALPGTIFRENTAALQANFMTAWETNFLLAEAAQRRLITADARTLYELAVTQAFAYWDTALPSSYLTTGEASFGINGQDPIEQIITQKWIANTINGYEGWIEYRRTGFPQLKTVEASLNNGLIPVRMPYPAEEAALNASSYQAATKDNQNSINSPVWWDVE